MYTYKGGILHKFGTKEEDADQVRDVSSANKERGKEEKRVMQREAGAGVRCRCRGDGGRARNGSREQRRPDESSVQRLAGVASAQRAASSAHGGRASEQVSGWSCPYLATWLPGLPGHGQMDRCERYRRYFGYGRWQGVLSPGYLTAGWRAAQMSKYPGDILCRIGSIEQGTLYLALPAGHLGRTNRFKLCTHIDRRNFGLTSVSGMRQHEHRRLGPSPGPVFPLPGAGRLHSSTERNAASTEYKGPQCLPHTLNKYLPPCTITTTGARNCPWLSYLYLVLLHAN